MPFHGRTARGYPSRVATATKSVHDVCVAAKEASHALARADRADQGRLPARPRGPDRGARGRAAGGESRRPRHRPRGGPERGADRPPDAERRARSPRWPRACARSPSWRTRSARSPRSWTLRERAAGAEAAGAARRRRDRLRGAAERDDRRRRALPEERQRGGAARVEHGRDVERLPRRPDRRGARRRPGCPRRRSRCSPADGREQLGRARHPGGAGGPDHSARAARG